MATTITVWSKDEIRGVIRFLWAKGCNPTDIHKELTTVYSGDILSVQQVRWWCREFASGRTAIEDEQRSGRPSVSLGLVAEIDAVLKKNRRVSLTELEGSFNLSRGTLWNIVHEQLDYRKVCSRWVPRQLTEDHKSGRMGSSLNFLQRYAEEGESFLGRIVTGDETWVHHYSPESKMESMIWKHTASPPVKKFKTVPSAGKVMATVFWDIKGVLLVAFLRHGETVNASGYQGTLKQLKEAIRKKRPGLQTEGVLLLHDNARPHTAQSTVDLLHSWKWEVLPHPPYSPDLAPSDFHLFPCMKKYLRGRHFQTDDEVKSHVQEWLHQQSPQFFYTGFDSLVYRCDKCLNNFGDYVEK